MWGRNGDYMKIELIKYPSAEDWMLVKACTLVTIGKEAKTPPTPEWCHKLLEARHSPIRELKFVFRLEGIGHAAALRVEVFYAQNPLAALLLGGEPGEQGGVDITQVHTPRG